MWKKFGIKNFALSVLFPRFCLGCQKEGNYLCEDCLSTIEISEHQYCLCKKPQRIWQGGKCQKCRARKLNGLYFAAPYQNNLVQNLIHSFKYKPFIKELSKLLASLIINHFQLLDNPPAFLEFLLLSIPLDSNPPATHTPPPSISQSEYVLIPIPLNRKRLKQRGFNQAEELAKELSSFLKIPLISDCLIKIKETLPQVELSGKKREENIKGVFFAKNTEKIRGRKILLVDDIYTTGSTMEEAAQVLKEFGAKEVWGVVVARG